MRSTAETRSLVAILVEEGGPGVLAVPVSARAGVVLEAPSCGETPGWVLTLLQTARTLGGGVERVLLGLDADAGLTCTLGVDGPYGISASREVPIYPEDGLVLARCACLPLLAEDDVLRLRGLDLSERTIDERVSMWRRSAPEVLPDDLAHT